MRQGAADGRPAYRCPYRDYPARETGDPFHKGRRRSYLAPSIRAPYLALSRTRGLEAKAVPVHPGRLLCF